LEQTEMEANRAVEETLRQAQNILWDALPSDQPADAAVDRMRTLLWSPRVNKALYAASDTLHVFALRAAQHAVADRSHASAAAINELWSILDDPWLNAALGIPHDARVKFNYRPK